MARLPSGTDAKMNSAWIDMTRPRSSVALHRWISDTSVMPTKPEVMPVTKYAPTPQGSELAGPRVDQAGALGQDAGNQGQRGAAAGRQEQRGEETDRGAHRERREQQAGAAGGATGRPGEQHDADVERAGVAQLDQPHDDHQQPQPGSRATYRRPARTWARNGGRSFGGGGSAGAGGAGAGGAGAAARCAAASGRESNTATAEPRKLTALTQATSAIPPTSTSQAPIGPPAA